jgi:hypothetical protein
MKEQGRLRTSPLEQFSCGETHGIRPGHNDMVEDSDTHKCKRVLELPRKRLVGTGWLRYARGVIMGDNRPSHPSTSRQVRNPAISHCLAVGYASNAV